MKTRHLFLGTSLTLLMLTLYACAPVGVTEKQYGFLYGLAHGFLFYFAVISKVMGMEFDLYAHNNTGLLYWIGYAIGVFSVGGGIFSTRWRRR